MERAVVRQELSGLAASQIAIEDGPIDGRQVHEHQGVDGVAEGRIHIESDQASVQFEVLPTAALAFPCRPDSARSTRRLISSID